MPENNSCLFLLDHTNETRRPPIAEIDELPARHHDQDFSAHMLSELPLMNGLDEFLRSRGRVAVPASGPLSQICSLQLLPPSNPAQAPLSLPLAIVTPPPYEPYPNYIIPNCSLYANRALRSAVFALHSNFIEREFDEPEILVSASCGLWIVNPTQLTQRSFSGSLRLLERIANGCSSLDKAHVFVQGIVDASSVYICSQLVAMAVGVWWVGKDAHDCALWILDLARRRGVAVPLSDSSAMLA